MYKTLLVDDIEIFMWEAKRLKTWGESTGFCVTQTARNGADALKELQADTFDLVLTDIRMPIMDGIELLQQVKKERLCPCVVLLSEYSEFEYARCGIVLGACDYIVKPLTEEVLQATLARARVVIEQHRTEMRNNAEEVHAQVYLEAEQKQVISLLNQGNSEALVRFDQISQNLYAMLGGDRVKFAALLKRFYLNILTRMISKNAWLDCFVNLSLFYEQGYGREDGAGIRQAYRDKLAALLALLRKFRPEVGNSIVSRVCDYVIGHIESPLTLKAVADSLYINHTYLSNTFKKKTGMNFIDYITLVKMERARYLIGNTPKKSYEISAQIGYNDPEYFSRLFKKHSGFSPTEYKKKFVKKG